MSSLPFGNPPPHRLRRWVPTTIDLGDWGQIEPLFDRLENDMRGVESVPALEEWLLQWSELTAVLDQEASVRYIAMTCHTDDPAIEQAYLHFVEQIEPQSKPRQFRLAQAFLAHPQRAQLPLPRYEVLDRDLQLQVELYRPENVPLETEEARLGQQYQKIIGSLAVTFRGEERTLVQMGRYQEETDRALRQEAWEMVARRRLEEAERLDELFDQLNGIRATVAKNAGHQNYRDYAFRRLGRFDYTPADCEQFHATVETEFMPLVRELHRQRCSRLGLDELRPWDMAVDPLGLPLLRPFEKTEAMVAGAQRIFDRLDQQLGEGFRLLDERGLLDLENRRGKAPGGYQSTLQEARLPFIFMNSVGQQRDVETILHEAGHAFHALATRDEDLVGYRSAPIEFCEVASMSMELLGNDFLEEFYTPADAQRARRTHLEGIVQFFPWMATVDAFQHWVHTHPGHSRDDRRQAWDSLMQRFGGEVNWAGWEGARSHLWHRQLHIFLHPFYYVEYGIAQLGALQVWANARRDRQRALNDYHRGLALGGSRRLPELFEAAGCRFDFKASAVRPLIRLVREELDRLSD